MAMRNRRERHARRPTEKLTADGLALEEAPLPSPRDGEVIIRNRILSIDPDQRRQMLGAQVCPMEKAAS